MKPLGSLIKQFQLAYKQELIERMYIDTYTIQVEFVENTPMSVKQALMKHIQQNYTGVEYVSLSTRNQVIFIELSNGAYDDYLKEQSKI